MKNLSVIKTLFKENIWLAAILGIAFYFIITITYNSVSPAEAQTLLGYKLIFNGINYSANSTVQSSPIPTIILSVGDSLGGVFGARIIAVLLGLMSLFVFYKFTDLFLEDSLASILSVIVLLTSSTFIFSAKTASNDIVSFLFFVSGLYFLGLIQFGKSGKLTSVFAGIFLFFAFSSNYMLLAYLPLLFFGDFLSKEKSKYLLTYGILIVACGLYFILLPGEFAKHFSAMHSVKSSIPMTKQLVSLFQFIVIPLILFITLFSERSKYFLNNKTYSFFAARALLIVLLQLLSSDYQAISRNMLFAVLFLSPLTGLLLKDYLVRHSNTRITVVIVLIASLLLSVYKVNLLEDSYPNTKKISGMLQENSGLNTIVVCENAEIMKYYLFPKLLLNQFIEIKNATGSENQKEIDRKIIQQIIDGKADLIYLNELINPELAERIKDAVSTKFYRTVSSQEYKISTALYQNSEGSQIIYKLK